MIKTRSLLAMAILSALASTSHADILTYGGDTTGSPTYDRLLEDLSGVSMTGTGVAYHAYAFRVAEPGTYTFLSTAGFDSFSFLYEGSFNPSQPAIGALVANDDLLGPTTSGFSYGLSAGTTYVWVTTSFDEYAYGAFTNTIGGAGAISAVPEPGSWLLMALGLAGGLAFVRRR